MRQRPSIGCTGRPAGLPGDTVAFVRRRLEDHGYGTSRPDVFWCPCHDGPPTLTVTRATAHLDRGLAVLRCAAGCSPAAILRALELRLITPADDDLPPHLCAVFPLAVDVSI